MTDLLEAVNLYKSFAMPSGRVQVLRGAGLTLQAGERLGIMGASGSGKSTLLHLLGGLDTPDEGMVLVEGEAMHLWGESKRAAFRAKRFGMVFQSYHLLPDLTVMENCLMPRRALHPWQSPGVAERQEAEQWLERVGLQDRMGHRPVELSGGEQQRVAIARALINNPDLLLADEPTGNLDAKTGTSILDLLFELSEGEGRAMVVVTHDPGVSSRCERTLLIDAGRVLDEGSEEA